MVFLCFSFFPSLGFLQAVSRSLHVLQHHAVTRMNSVGCDIEYSMGPATPRGSVSDNEYRLFWVAMKSYLEMQLHSFGGRTDAKQSRRYFCGDDSITTP